MLGMMVGTVWRFGEGSWLPLPLIVAALITGVLAIVTGSPPSTCCSLSLAILMRMMRPRGRNKGAKINSVRSNFSLCCCCTKKKEWVARGRWSHSLFDFPPKLFRLLLVPWAGIHNSKDGLYLNIPVWIISDTTPQGCCCVLFSSPYSSEMRMTPCLECRFYAGAAPFTFQNRRRRKKGDPIVVAGDRCTLIHTDTQNTDVVA